MGTKIIQSRISCQALQLRGPELRHAAMELRKDKELVLQAVKQAGKGLRRSWEKSLKWCSDVFS